MEDNIKFDEVHFKRIWKEMKQRCNNPNHQKYKSYGALGVKVCDDWNLYINFKNDMLESYINFITNNGEKNIRLECSNNLYSKSTCHWETYDINSSLNKNARRYKYNGQLLTISELHDRYSQNLSLRGLIDRINKEYNVGDEIRDETLYQFVEPISFLTTEEDVCRALLLNSYDKYNALTILLQQRDGLI